jgi:hypothetical protein
MICKGRGRDEFLVAHDGEPELEARYIIFPRFAAAGR